MDTFKDEFWKSLATKAANKVSSPSLSPIRNNRYLEYLSISNDLVIMGPLTSIPVNSVLSLCILFQGLKIYLVSKYTFAKNAHPYNENFFQYEIIQINTNNILHRIIKIRKFSYMFTV